MKHVRMTSCLALLAAFGGLAEADDWSVIDADIEVRDEVRNIAPERHQVEVMQRWVEWRIENILPRLMRRHDIDAWIVPRRREPTYLTLVEANREGMVLRRPRYLVMHAVEDSVERLEVPEAEDLDATLSKLGPAAPATSAETREELEGLLPEPMLSRLRDSEVLEVEFLQEHPPVAISVFEHVARVSYEVYAEAFSNIAVTPDVTTSDDLNWWIRDRYKALGLETFDHPTVTVQRVQSLREKYGDPDEAFQIEDSPRNGHNVVLRRGDLIFADTGIKYFGLNTDAQQCAYILKPGETDMPEGLRRAFANSRRLQDIVMEELRPDRTGGDVWDASMARAEAEELRADLYSHPLPLYLMRYELNGRLLHLERYGTGPDIGRDEGGHERNFRIGSNTVYALEQDVLYAVPEWGGQEVRMLMETNIAVTDHDARFLGGRQGSCYLIH